MAIYLFWQILKFLKYSIKLIEKLSRRHLINSSDVFVIKGFTVEKKTNVVFLIPDFPIFKYLATRASTEIKTKNVAPPPRYEPLGEAKFEL